MKQNDPTLKFQGLQILYKNISELKPYSSHARKHTQRKIKKIGNSIRNFGFICPLLIDKDGVVITGHARLSAAKLIKQDEIPVVLIEHLTAEQIRTYRIADNRLTEFSEWDEALLAIEFQELAEIAPDLNLTITGFGEAEVDLLLKKDKQTDEIDEDVRMFLSTVPVSRRGDIWLLGNHKILCGSALDLVDYEKLMGDERAQACITDPPYNVKIDGHVSGNGANQHAEFAMASGEMSSNEFTAFLEQSFRNIASYAVDGSLHYIFMDWRHVLEISTAGNRVYDEFKNIIVWNKDNGGMGSLYRSKHELVFLFKKGKAAHVNNIELGKYGRYRSNVWEYSGQNTFHANRNEELSMHPTVKPVRMIADAILDATRRGDIILDPFGGSGTAILAAEKTGRKARIIELEPSYVDLSIRRWQAITGLQAIHSQTGESFSTRDIKSSSLQGGVSHES